jgi:glycosyltransferase involved in cell wall biosynthesis
MKSRNNSRAKHSLAKVTILLALYNGATHLREQLDSLVGQTEADWQLLVGDDGSGDAGPQIVQDYALRCKPGQIRLGAGPGRGGAENFLQLLAQVPTEAPYTCFSDQDDVWLPHKLARAIEQIEAAAEQGPVCYFSRTLICNADLSDPQPSRRQSRPLGFRNALVQNVVAGNTIVLNAAARAVLQAAQAEIDPAETVLFHDWWIYQILSGVGARFISDDVPGLLYRQHRGNWIGANHGLSAQAQRLGIMLHGAYAGWNRQNLAVLRHSAHRFSTQNQRIFQSFHAARQGAHWWQRLAALHASQVYRQTWLSQQALYFAAITNRL